MIKWLLVDIGDVLLLKDRVMPFTQLLADELGVNIALAEQINKIHYTTMETKYVPEEVFVAELEEELGYKAPANIYSYFEKAYEKQISPNRALFAFLDEVRTSGVKTAILSNTIAVYQAAHERAGISKKNGFDPILYSWRVEMRKPNKEIFELAIKELGGKPEEIIFIDDKSEHLQAAEQLGMKTILFDDTKNVVAKIRKLLQ